MASESHRDLLANPLPLAAILLLAAGVLVPNLPLKSPRPPSDDRPTIQQPSYQDVEARLWQDPMTVRATAIPNRDLRKPRNPDEEDPLHAPERLANQVTEVLASASALSVIAVMIPGGTYPENAELRRRARVAVVAALQAERFHPDTADALGYVWTRRTGSAPGQASRLPEIVPYEWFTGDQRRRLLVLWIDEDTLDPAPIRALGQLSTQLLCPPGQRGASHSRSCRWRDTAPELRVVGPSDSRTLAAIDAEAARLRSEEDRASDDYVRVRLYSSGATIAAKRLPGIGILEAVDPSALTECRPGSYCVSLRRLTVPDDVLARGLAHELILRGLALSPLGASAAASRRCGTVVLVSEADTRYGRALGDEVDAAIRSECEREGKRAPELRHVHYFRGLDGLAPATAKTTPGSGDRAKAGGNEDLELRTAPRELAEGRSQYDYLRRVAAELLDADAADRRAGGGGIRAVGLFGSDVYDKLLILQALHRQLPNATFFTTDLDARLLHPEQSEWARNLVVASAFDLALADRFQGAAPVFRDTYQTGTYLATLSAVDPAVEAAARARAKDWFGSALLFEIGRTRAVPLNARSPATIGAGCSLERPDACQTIHPEREPSAVGQLMQVWRLYRAQLWVALAAGVLLLFATSTAFTRNWAACALASAAVAGTVIGISAIAIRDDASGAGEPLEWLEGVSLWPTVYLRALAALLAIVLLVAGWRLIKRSTRNMHRRFFAAGRAETRKDDQRRTPWRALWLRLAAPFLRRLGVPAQSWFIPPPPLRFDLSAPTPRSTWWTNLWPRTAYTLTHSDLARHATADGDRLDVASFWREHCERSRFGACFARVAVTLMLFIGVSFALFLFDPPNLPFRGETVRLAFGLSTFCMTFLMWALIFAVVDVTRRATRLVNGIAARQALWPDRVVAQHARKTGLSEGYVEPLIGFEAVRELTKAVNRFIYFPFAVVLIGVVSRSTLIDSLNFPLPLLLVYVGAVLYLVYCGTSLRKAAERARSAALKAYETKLELVKSGRTPPTAAGNHPPADKEHLDDLRQQFEAAIARIRKEREGAFAPFLQQPHLGGLLLPMGGASGMSLLEYFTIGHM